MAWLFALAAGLVYILGPRAARADGAFPASEGILTPAALPHEIVLATNFGLVASNDDGQTWVWSCEQDQNSFGIFYQVGAPPLNRLYVVSQGRLVFSDDAGCSWTVAGGGPAGVTIADVFPDPSDANHVLSIAQVNNGDAGILYSVMESRDAGTTLGTIRYQAAAGDVINGIEIARSRPATIYMTLLSGSTFIPKLGRSDDSGSTWHLYDVGAELGQKTTSALLISVDPTDPERVLLRVRGAAGERVAMTTDGGVTATVPLELPGGVVNSFARTQSGTLVVGGFSGVAPVAFRSTDRGQTFTALPAPPNLGGLSARGDTLYVVADNFADGYAIGVSSDEGMTWQPLVRYDQIQAIAACVKTMCQDDCHMRADMGQWPDAMCDATPMPQPIITDAGAHDAAAPDAPVAPADAGRDASAADAAVAGPRAGCGCAVAPAEGPAAALAIALALATLARLRRRNER